MEQHNLSTGLSSSHAHESLTLEVRKGSRYGFDGQTEIIGDVATSHRQDHYAR